VNLDEDPENADWPKRTWDLPTDMDEVRALLRAWGMTVEEFKRLPVYRWNVDKVPGLKDL